MGNQVLSDYFGTKASLAPVKGGVFGGRSRRKGGRLELASNDSFRSQMNKKPRLTQTFTAKASFQVTKGGESSGTASFFRKSSFLASILKVFPAFKRVENCCLESPRHDKQDAANRMPKFEMVPKLWLFEICHFRARNISSNRVIERKHFPHY